MVAGPPDDAPQPVRGRVVGAAGDPVAGALVVILESSVPVPEIALQADADGRFALRLPPGRFTLRAHGPDGTGDARIELPGAAEVELVLAAA
jgi:hypothetical protein